MSRLSCILTLVLLSGCGESVSDYKRNEKTREAIQDLEHSTEQRLQSLEDRMSAVEKKL